MEKVRSAVVSRFVAVRAMSGICVEGSCSKLFETIRDSGPVGLTFFYSDPFDGIATKIMNASKKKAYCRNRTSDLLITSEMRYHCAKWAVSRWCQLLIYKANTF